MEFRNLNVVLEQLVCNQRIEGGLNIYSGLDRDKPERSAFRRPTSGAIISMSADQGSPISPSNTTTLQLA